MTNQDKRVEFDSKVKALVDKGFKHGEICEKLNAKSWAVQNSLYRLGYGMTKECDDRPNIDAYLEAKLIFGDAHKNAKPTAYEHKGKKYQDVSSFFGI